MFKKLRHRKSLSPTLARPVSYQFSAEQSWETL